MMADHPIKRVYYGVIIQLLSISNVEISNVEISNVEIGRAQL